MFQERNFLIFQEVTLRALKNERTRYEKTSYISGGNFEIWKIKYFLNFFL